MTSARSVAVNTTVEFGITTHVAVRKTAATDKQRLDTHQQNGDKHGCDGQRYCQDNDSHFYVYNNPEETPARFDDANIRKV